MVEPSDAVSRARQLARFHDEAVAPAGPSLIDYAESTRAGDWSLRSALVRFAQPHPALAGAVLELVRRTDSALHPHRRTLEANPCATLPDLDADTLDGSSSGIALDPTVPGATVSDAAVTDLARLLVRHPDGVAIVDGYDRLRPLRPEERDLLPVLAVAVELDAIADVLVTWADQPDRSPVPAAEVESRAGAAFARLEAAGVPRETGPPRRGR